MAVPKTEITLAPQKGPQHQFVTSDADVVIYGGAAGGGKSYGLALIAARCAYTIPGFYGVIFRKTYPELVGPGGLWEESRDIFGVLGARGREQQLDWKWPNGSILKFSHLQHDKNVNEHQGKQYAFIGFDELTHFSARQFWYLLSRNRTTAGVRPFVRATCNAEPGWVADFIKWYVGEDGYAIPERCGKLRYFARGDQDDVLWGDTPEEIPPFPDGTPREVLSFTFIASDLSDNKILTEKDPTYRAKLMNLPRVDRERLLGAPGKKGGNWKITDGSGLYFNREWFRIIYREPEPQEVVHWVRGWDKAATKPTSKNPDPDWTVGVRIGRYANGRYIVDARSIVRMRGSVFEVEQAILRAAEQDGRPTHVAFWQDPGQAGVVDREAMCKLLPHRTVLFCQARESKTHYWGPLSSQVEQGRVDLLLPPDGESKEFRAFMYTLENVRGDGKEHDDDADALARAYLEICNPPSYGYVPAPPDRTRFVV